MREAVAPVARYEQAVAANIDGVGVVPGDQTRTYPVPAIRILALRRGQPQAHHVAGPVVKTGPRTVLRVDVDGASVRVGLLVHPVAEAALAPLVVHDPLPRAGRRGAHPGVVVLHAAVDPVRVPVVDGDPVELPDRDIVDAPEGHAPVVGLVQPRVAGEVEVVGVGRVDPHRVVVGVDAHVVGGALRDLGEGASAVLAPVRRGRQRVDAVLVGGVDEDVRVIHRPDVLVAHLLPALAAVLAAVSTRFGGMLNKNVKYLGIGGGHGDPDTALVALGQPVGELAPAVAAVGGLVEAAARTAAVESPGAPLALVHGRVQHVGVGGIDD